MPTPVWLGVAAGASSVIAPAFNVTVAAYRYALAPDGLQARTQSAVRLITWSTIPLAPVVAGALLLAAGSTTTLLVLAALMLAVAVVATSSRTVRHAPPLNQPAAAETPRPRLS